MEQRTARYLLALLFLALGLAPSVGLASPPDAAALCAAAQRTINSGKSLELPPTANLAEDVLNRVHLATGWNGEPAQVSHVVAGGRAVAPVVVDSGGTSHDTLVYVLSEDLRTLLSPPDRNARDPENDGSDDWGFGVSEQVVMVLGQPMVLSRNRRDSDAPSHLSIITSSGDMVPTCEVTARKVKARQIAFSANDAVCQSMVTQQQRLVPMHAPAPGESIVLGIVPREYSDLSAGGGGHTRAGVLHYRNAERASQVTYTLLATGTVDPANSGSPRHIGLVSFFDGESTAGDGTYQDTQVLPVYFSHEGVADLSSGANQRLAAALPHGMRGGTLVAFKGVTYLELSPETNGPATEVWKISPGGASRVCGFKLRRTVVTPISN